MIGQVQRSPGPWIHQKLVRFQRVWPLFDLIGFPQLASEILLWECATWRCTYSNNSREPQHKQRRHMFCRHHNTTGRRQEAPSGWRSWNCVHTALMGGGGRYSNKNSVIASDENPSSASATEQRIKIPQNVQDWMLEWPFNLNIFHYRCGGWSEFIIPLYAPSANPCMKAQLQLPLEVLSTDDATKLREFECTSPLSCLQYH